jgi:hypothetical protein
MKTLPSIPKPCKEEVKFYLKKNESSKKYDDQTKAVSKIFKNCARENKTIEDILIKVSCVNQFDSTNIFDIHTVANHILHLNIDERLASGDLDLVKDMGHVILKDKPKYFYSFATKYCAHHSSEVYPIYDSYVSKILVHFKREYQFAEFKVDDLRDYQIFNDTIEAFIKFFGLNEYKKSEIDRYI